MGQLWLNAQLKKDGMLEAKEETFLISNIFTPKLKILSR